jgi:hypothetical protein
MILVLSCKTYNRKLTTSGNRCLLDQFLIDLCILLIRLNKIKKEQDRYGILYHEMITLTQVNGFNTLASQMNITTSIGNLGSVL